MDSGLEIVEVAGTSGGSIAAACVASGMNRDQMRKMAIDTDFEQMLRFGLWNFLSSGTYCDGRRLQYWLEGVLHLKTFNKLNIPCQIFATHVEAMRAFVFSDQRTPTASVALACRASCAVPFVFRPVKWDATTTLVDGGAVNDCPVDRLNHKSARFGVHVDTPRSGKAHPIWKYAGTMVGLLMRENEDSHIHLGVSTGATIVDVKTSIGFLNVRMTIKDKHDLFLAGYDAMMANLQSKGLA
jgi:NTE family protein